MMTCAYIRREAGAADRGWMIHRNRNRATSTLAA
jgi:hypothetical protein